MRLQRYHQVSRIGAKRHMGLPLVLDIAIGLIFIYLILSLLASELQEILATLLQWRAVHLKKSIEVLLTGGEGKAENQVKEFSDRLYSNPLIKNINQEAKGWLETSLRSITWGLGSIYRQIKGLITGRGRSTFGGSRHSGPSYLNAETFTTTLLETSGIPVLVRKLSELKLEEFIQKEIQGKIEKAQNLYAVAQAERQNSLLPTLIGPELAEAEAGIASSTAELEVSQATPSIETGQSLPEPIEAGFKKLIDHLNSIFEDFRSNKSPLDVSLKRIAYRLDRYIETCQQTCPKNNRAQDFLEELKDLRQELFENDPISGAIAVKPFLQNLVQPTLIEVVEAVTDQDSPTYRRLSSIIGQKINSLLPEKLACALVQEIRAVLEEFNVITQGTALYTELEMLQQNLNRIANSGEATTENKSIARSHIDLVHQMLELRNGYISNAGNYVADEFFLQKLEHLKQIPLETLKRFKEKLISELDAVLDSFRDIKLGTQPPTSLKNLGQVLEGVTTKFEQEEVQLLFAINQMLGARDAYIDDASQYVAKAQIPVKQRDKLLRRINTPKQNKDFLRSVDEQQRTIFWNFGNHVAMIAWLGAAPEELDWEIKQNTEIYQQISSLIKDKNINTYTDVVMAIARLPKPIKDSLSVLARRAQEKSTTLENEVKQLQFEIETWFDRSMERATGVYKRNAKGVAILLGSLIAISVNADTFHIVNRLSKNTVLRNAIAENATQVVEQSPDDFSKVRNRLETDLEALPLPIGWDKTNRDQQFLSNGGRVPPLAYFKSFLGWIVSGIAISMGASFWFDLLGKVVNVRNSGKPPEKTQAK
ncbi:hypothetical protein H6F90_18665 [Trichocoleus sp. FACHB-591]|uniref:hypothetical protein n=1 Tax=Trichocoleus sp. FACHB-591 TaxID=2692872 RepID=UPI0019941AA1|nr:hypothetical protein [Trichocoleus sp. FACHB-591]MBD2097126.1 hypothetical protein [Trichocoleus sp. FACHB-591]